MNEIYILNERLEFERQLVKRQELTIEKLTEQLEKKVLQANTFRTLLEDIDQSLMGGMSDTIDLCEKIEPLLKEYPEEK